MATCATREETVPSTISTPIEPLIAPVRRALLSFDVVPDVVMGQFRLEC